MKILILAAMEKEINLLLNILDNLKETEVEGIKIAEGEFKHHTIMIGKCGIGKVNAAINTLILLRALKPDLLINSGVAGGAGLPISTVLVADKVAYHDVWCGPGTEYGQADGMPLFMFPSAEFLNMAKEITEESLAATGLICSGDKFISSAEEINKIREHFPEVKAVDMESAAIAQVALQTGTPFAVIRVVSDTPGEGENISQYKDFWTKAPEKTFEVLKKILTKIE